MLKKGTNCDYTVIKLMNSIRYIILNKILSREHRKVLNNKFTESGKP